MTPNGLEALPIGAGLDEGGVFRWQPGVGFVGPYDFVFNSQDGTHQVRIVLNPKSSGRVGPQVVIDTPSHSTKALSAGQPFDIAGWAADLDAEVQTGVDAVHVWAYPHSGADPIFIGNAALNGAPARMWRPSTAMGSSRPGTA